MRSLILICALFGQMSVAETRTCRGEVAGGPVTIYLDEVREGATFTVSKPFTLDIEPVVRWKVISVSEVPKGLQVSAEAEQFEGKLTFIFQDLPDLEWIQIRDLRGSEGGISFGPSHLECSEMAAAQ